jgi:hypothetical protein
MLERREGAFIAHQENLAVGCQKPGHVQVGAGHVRPTSLEASLGTRYVRSET